MPNTRSMTVAEAGRKGGMTVLAKHGRGHFSKIGCKGQQALRKKHPNMASVWGKKGGRPRKPDLYDMGDQVNIKRGGCGPASTPDPPPAHYKRA